MTEQEARLMQDFHSNRQPADTVTISYDDWRLFQLTARIAMETSMTDLIRDYMTIDEARTMRARCREIVERRG